MDSHEIAHHENDHRYGGKGQHDRQLPGCEGSGGSVGIYHVIDLQKPTVYQLVPAIEIKTGKFKYQPADDSRHRGSKSHKPGHDC